MELIQSLMERLQGRAGAASVFGEPIVAEGRTLIPCAKLAFGFGGGSGTRAARGGDGDAGGREGTGGGGGVAARPIGVLEVTEAGTRFIPFGDPGKLVGAMLAGVVLGVLIGRRRSRR